jgi:hypothetical protein
MVASLLRFRHVRRWFGKSVFVGFHCGRAVFCKGEHRAWGFYRSMQKSVEPGVIRVDYFPTLACEIASTLESHYYQFCRPSLLESLAS